MMTDSIIHYHGTPVWGDAGNVHRVAVNGAGAFVSFARPDQLAASIKYASAVAIDNGAFSAWKRGLVINWQEFYQWLLPHYHHPKVSFFVIPDVVEGGEADNDALIDLMPRCFRDKAAPVWHLHESLNRLIELCNEWPRVCFGSSGDFASIRTERWHRRMHEAFDVIYQKNNFKTKIHGLRMLDGRVLGNYPLATADSTNLACNIPKFTCKYPEITRFIQEAEYNQKLNERDLKAAVLMGRCAILKNAIESVTPLTIHCWTEMPKNPQQLELLVA